MRAFFWLMRVPGAAWIFFHVVLSLWNMVCSNLEAFIHLRSRGRALEKLALLRRWVSGPKGLATWYRDAQFRWAADPLGGWLDFSSKPWVTVIKNAGDCDDTMLLAEAVLPGGRRCYTYGTDGSGHAVYLLRTSNDAWFMVSNMRVLGPFATEEEAATFYHGPDTAFTYVI